jgi:hypothetical protein
VHPRAQSAPFHGALDNLSQITALMASLLMLKAVTVIVVRTRGGSGTNQIACWVEVLQLCSHPVIGWQDAPPGIFGLWFIQVAAI